MTHGSEQPQAHRRPRRRIRVVLLWALVGLSAILLATAVWIRYRFGAVTFEQIVLNLPIDGGEGVGNGQLAVEGVVFCILLPSLLLCVGAYAVRKWQRRHEDRISRASRRWYLTVLPLVSFAVSLGLLLSAAGVPQYAVALIENRTFEPYYVEPDTSTGVEQPRNLVTIYLESMENTFADESLFGTNLLEPLDEVTVGWADYASLHQYPGGGWTMAGLVGTQCGIPLKSRALLAGADPNIYGEQVDRYLPNVTCLGDILEDHGYTSVFLGGAAAGFAGKSKFLLEHGYSEVSGLADWRDRGEDPEQISTQWGLSDARLFANAKDTVTALRAAGTPFNLTLLTLDTHEPGQVYPGCDTDSDNVMVTALTCSLRAVADFITYLSDNGFLDDTVVVVMGDHLKGTGEGIHFSSELESVADRTIVFRVSSPDPVQFTRPSADQFSVFPTTLSLLHLVGDSGQAGLGVTFAGSYDLTGTALTLPEDEYISTVTSPSSDIYRQFWGGQGN